MKDLFLIFLLLLLVSCVQIQQPGQAPELIDLTHAFGENTIYWPTAKPFKMDVVFKGENPLGFHYEANNFSGAEHCGTHLDAPVHFFDGSQTAEEIPLERLVGPGALIDVSVKCAEDRDYLVTSGDFVAWEKAHGKPVDGHIVLLRTGFGDHWPDRTKYLGTDKQGPDAVAELHFPGLHPDAAKWLVENRKIKAIGIDTPSIDFGQSKRFQSHVTLFEQNIPAFENVANLSKLPEKGFTVVALPMKIAGGSGAPLRIIATLP